MNPDIQKKAQQEIDAVVGPHRLPTMDDIPDLPYVQAILMESLRWMPVLPLNLQHDVLEDDEYEGYMIPRGFSMIVVCLYHGVVRRVRNLTTFLSAEYLVSSRSARVTVPGLT